MYTRCHRGARASASTTKSCPSRRTHSRRSFIVHADGDKEVKESPGDKEKEGAGLPAFLKPLTDFGVGRTSVWEGGVGLFIIVGAGVSNFSL